MKKHIATLMKGSLVALVALLSLAPAAPVASAQRARVAVVYGGGGWYGPGWYGPRWGWGWYGPGPGFYGPRYYGPAPGKVKIVTNVKGNSIYVDGGFAGYTGKLKKFQLRPGPHQIEVRDASGHAFYAERVNVLVGKTLDIHPDPAG